MKDNGMTDRNSPLMRIVSAKKLENGKVIVTWEILEPDGSSQLTTRIYPDYEIAAFAKYLE